ncbi:uncharacterized protein [Anabrus simplex]|uniref:uncharacterized protein isoform X2 n=1 Tax=Anabrus simplex TaxID=316456 RepID=UPI0035A291C7
MVSRKSTARRMVKKEAERLEDDTSFMLQSFQENNIALAKALAKQKAMQKDFKEMEVANNILKAKGKMCARQCKELTEVLDEHLQVVLGQVSTFVDSLMVIASVVKKHKQKNEALLQMIENDEIAEVPVTAMSRTQLVNPMVGGHTLKKASIALQRLDMTNLNMAQNNGMPVEDDEARGDGIDRTRPMNRVTQTLEVDEEMLVNINGDENPAVVQEEPVVIQDIQVSGSGGRAGRGRPRSRPPRTTGTNEDVPVVLNSNEVAVEVREEPAVIHENGVSSDEDSDAEVSIVEANPAQNSHPLRRNSSTQVNDSSFSADTSAILDMSIQTKFPHYPLGRPLRSPSVSLERLNIRPSSRSMPSSQRQLGQPTDVNVLSASSVQCNKTVRQQISNHDNFSNRVNRNSSTHGSDLVVSSSSESCQVNRKLSHTVNLVDIRSSISLNKACSTSQTNLRDEEEIVSLQEPNRLVPRVSLVDIGNNLKSSQKPCADSPEEIACIFEGRNLNPRVHLVDIGKPNYGDANDAEVVCFADSRTVESRVNFFANDGTSYDESTTSLSDISVKLTTDRKVNGSAEMSCNKELKIMLPKVDVNTPSLNRRSREPSVSRVSGTSVVQSCPNENKNSVLHFQDSIVSLVSSGASQVTPQKNNERTNSEIGSSPSGTKLIPRVNLVDIISSPPKAGSKPNGRKVISSSEKVQEVGQAGEKKSVVALHRDAVEELQKKSVHNGRFRKRRTPTAVPGDSSPVLSRNVVQFSVPGRKSEDDIRPVRKEEQSPIVSPQKVPTPTGRKRMAPLNVTAISSDDMLQSRYQGKKPSSLSRLEAIQNSIQSVTESMNQQRSVVDISESQPMVNGLAEESAEPRPADRVQGPSVQTQDSRSGYYTRHHGNSDPSFCVGSSDEEEISFDSPYPPRKKKRKHSDNSKRSATTATENKTKSSDLAQGRRSLRLRQKTSRQTIKERKIS